jgi:hypothetical protein
MYNVVITTMIVQFRDSVSFSIGKTKLKARALVVVCWMLRFECVCSELSGICLAEQGFHLFVSIVYHGTMHRFQITNCMF